jgi:hypothetical protein
VRIDDLPRKDAKHQTAPTRLRLAFPQGAGVHARNDDKPGFEVADVVKECVELWEMVKGVEI